MFSPDALVDSASGELLGSRLRVAEVVGIEPAGVVVAFDVLQVTAAVAVLDYQPEHGDRVLVIGDEASYFVIGVLATARPRAKLQLERDEHTGTTTLAVADGDLQLSAPRGRVRLASAAGVDVATAGAVAIQSGAAVQLSIVDRLGRALGRLRLSRSGAQLQHDDVRLDAGRLHVETSDCAVAAQQVRAEVGSLSLEARRVDVRMATLLSHVENAYHTVTGLWQLLADRTRMVVQGTSHHKAARIYSKADDVKVKADKIHLG